jgi:putative RNA 2'-phosphotransferase
MAPQYTKTSKFLSLVLRHKPDTIGLQIDKAGWASISELIEKARKAGVSLSPELIRRVVATNDKQRFSISSDGSRIRANQGHSIPVDLGLQEKKPPDFLYHGTATRNITAILKEGIKRGKRNFVHLSLDEETALMVGKRYGKPVVLIVQAGLMHRDGFQFNLSENGVWLAEYVPVGYIAMLKESIEEYQTQYQRIYNRRGT